jgi:1-acyl-sn-glycerol-3-phosphate acyltransferase
MIRAVIALVTFVVYTLVLAAVAALSGLWDRSGETVLRIGRFWSRQVLAASGVKLKIEHHAELDPSRPYVFMCNHASTIDVWAAFIAVPVSFRFIAKKQLARIPLFGWAMAAGRMIFIDRQNAVAARRSIEEAARRIRAGQSVVIFPEGTRTRDGKLMPFKKGGFHLAIDSGAAIVPMAISGSRALMPRKAMLIQAGEVRLQFGEPVPTAGLGTADRERTLKLVRERVAEMLGEPATPAPPSAENAAQ